MSASLSLQRHKLTTLALACVWVGCTDRVLVIDTPDAATSDAFAVDAPSPRTRCVVPEGARWVDMGSPANTTRSFQAAAVGVHGSDIVVATSIGTFRLEGTRWRAAPLIPAGNVTSIVWHRDGFWAGLGFGGGVVRENASHVWGFVTSPMDSEGRIFSTQRLLSFGGQLFSVSEEALHRYDAGADAWSLVPLLGRPLQVVHSANTITASTVDDAGVIHVQRSLDAVHWDTLTLPPDARLSELVAGPDYVLAADRADLTRAFRCDETARTFVPTTHGLPLVIAGDGSALFQRPEGLLSAPSPEAATTLVRAGAMPVTHTTFSGSTSEVFVDGADVVVLQELGVRTPVLRITPSRAAVEVLGAGMESAPLAELLTDGAHVAVRARINDAGDQTFVARVGESWRDVTPRMNASFNRLAAVDGMLLTRPGEYGLTPPQASENGGADWVLMRTGFPRYDTNAGTAVRRVTDYARGPDGLLYAATNGGTTSICCTGSMVPWAYRPGAGVWRWDGMRWSPVNAGIPIAAEPDGLGGPPFREDVLSLAVQGDSVFAVLAEHGVMRLHGDRWLPASTGLPVDASPELVALDDALFARVGNALYRRRGEVWLMQTTLEEGLLAGVHDVLIEAGTRVQLSRDEGRTWSPLPVPPSPAREVVLSHEHILLRGEDEHVHALALSCGGGA